jgi:MFS family permease
MVVAGWPAARVATVIRHNVPERNAGTILGYSTSSQYVGQVTGPLVGGSIIGGHFGMRAVFLGTSVLMAAGAVYGWISRPLALAELRPE